MDTSINHHRFHGSARWALSICVACSLPVVHAQLATDGGKAGMSPPPMLQYHSVFAQYQGFAEQPINSWVETNTTVGKIGGWRVYAKEARQRDAPESTEKAPMPNPKSGVHDGHGGKP